MKNSLTLRVSFNLTMIIFSFAQASHAEGDNFAGINAEDVAFSSTTALGDNSINDKPSCEAGVVLSVSKEGEPKNRFYGTGSSKTEASTNALAQCRDEANSLASRGPGAGICQEWYVSCKG